MTDEFPPILEEPGPPPADATPNEEAPQDGEPTEEPPQSPKDDEVPEGS